MKFIENLLLLLFAALLVLGVYNYIDSQPKTEEDNPTVDVLPDDGEQEETVETLTVNVCDENDSSIVLYTIEYEEGLTMETLDSFFIFVQQRIIGLLIRVIVTGKAPVKIYNFLQIRGKLRKVAFILCSFPYCLCIVDQHCVFHIFLSRNSVNLIILLA